MNPSREQILERIDSVPEPCGFLMRTPLSVLEMGLVNSVHIEGGRVCIEIVLTDASCVHWSSMRDYIADAVGDVDGVQSVEVVLSSTSLWTPDRLQRKEEQK